jgi:hypothetical protein
MNILKTQLATARATAKISCVSERQHGDKSSTEHDDAGLPTALFESR